MPMKTSIIDGSSNRVADAIIQYAEQEAQLYISNPLEGRRDLRDIELKLQYYNNVYNRFRRNATSDEKVSLHFMRHEMGKMRARLNPTMLNQILYSPVGNRIRNFINGNNLLYAKLNKKIKEIRADLVKEHNLQALSSSVKQAGFKIEIEGALKKMIDQDFPASHIRYADVHYPKTDFVLHFQKVPDTDLYYFEKFDAISRPTLESLLSNDPSCRRHTFSLLDQTLFTAGEAANLLNGKCVCKNMEGKESWLMLDATNQNQQQPFKRISFNLEKALDRLPINLNSSQYQALLQTLKAGNSKEVSININNNPVKYIIEAAPNRKTIDVLDRNGQLVDINKILSGASDNLTRLVMEKVNHQQQDIDLDASNKRRVKVR